MRTVFDSLGNKIQVPDDVPTNDLTRAPVFNSNLPANTLYSVVVIPSADGTPMLALVNPTLLATTAEVLQKISEARQALVNDGIARDNALAAEVARINSMQQTMSAMDTNQNTIIAQLAARKQVVTLPDFTVPASELVSLLATEKAFTKPIAGVKTTDTLSIILKSGPVGYGFRTYTIPSDGNLTISAQIPVLSLGGSPITFGVTAFRS